jgi:hypothetical protein
MPLILKQKPLTRADPDEFVACYHPENRHERSATWSETDITPAPFLIGWSQPATPSRGGLYGAPTDSSRHLYALLVYSIVARMKPTCFMWPNNLLGHCCKSITLILQLGAAALPTALGSNCLRPNSKRVVHWSFRN